MANQTSKRPAPKKGARAGSARRPKDPLPLGLDREDIALAERRAAAAAAQARQRRFRRGVAILTVVAVVIVAWAYVNAPHLGLPVDRWEREATRFFSGEPPAETVADQTDTHGSLSDAERLEVERLLAELNFDPGQVDGVIDPTTRAAIREYQAIAGTAQTGEASPALLRDLRDVAGLIERE